MAHSLTTTTLRACGEPHDSGSFVHASGTQTGLDGGGSRSFRENVANRLRSDPQKERGKVGDGVADAMADDSSGESNARHAKRYLRERKRSDTDQKVHSARLSDAGGVALRGNIRGPVAFSYNKRVRHRP
jgi:hypothetical protein